jgi:antitoxin component YwqK of YwqJK toxin-antitoxin module
MRLTAVAALVLVASIDPVLSAAPLDILRLPVLTAEAPRIEVPEEAEAPEASGGPARELIQERYPNRAMKVEREMIQDAQGNYLNDGSWKMWTPQGRLLGHGEYRNDVRHGHWVRYFNAGESPLLSGELVESFTAPFVSEATFNEGEIDGVWTVTDSQSRKILEWSFSRGQRHGPCAWYTPEGQKWLEANFNQGELDGESTEWAPDRTVLVRHKYVGGRRIGSETQWHAPGVKKIEAEYLFPREATIVIKDWWAGTADLTPIAKEESQKIRHGRYSEWDRNGQMIVQGEYRHDVPSGSFTWWYPSGQKSARGSYLDGKEHGLWVRWYPNGIKQMQGEYRLGELSGNWMRWTEAGKVVEKAEEVRADASSHAMAVPQPVAPPAEMPTYPSISAMALPQPVPPPAEMATEPEHAPLPPVTTARQIRQAHQAVRPAPPVQR